MRIALCSLAALLLAASSAQGASSFRFTAAGDVHAGKPIPMRFTCDGADMSPRLVWSGVPKKARELALVLEDPDAPGGTFTHWLVYGISPRARVLPRGAKEVVRHLRRPVIEGRNDFEAHAIGYGGPCPPPGQTHHYVFRLLALAAKLKLARGADRAAFDRALDHHVLAQARLVTTYARR